MTYEAKFRERGEAWFVYRGLTSKYRRADESMLSHIKIAGSTVTIHESNLLSDLERIANKCSARYRITEND